MMASPEFARGEEASRLSFEKEILRDAVSVPGLSRRDSSSTTGSGKPLPPGHWTFPISGNCPRCYHHHRSIKVHIKDVESSSRLADVHCEKCNKLWIGPGSGNSTRISLASNETLDPPPMEPEARTTLIHMIRAATRVATLSPTLPNIPETVAGPSHQPSTRDPNRGSGQEPGVRLSEQTSVTSPEAIPRSPVTTSVTSSPNRISKVNTSGVNAARSRRLVTSLKRKLGTTRLGRLPVVMRLLGENHLATVEYRQQDVQVPHVVSKAAGSYPLVSPLLSKEEQVQSPLGTIVKVDASTSPAVVKGGTSSLRGIDQETINAMSPEQRFAFLRSQITAFSTRYNTQTDPSSKSSTSGDQDHPLDALATIAAIHNSLLTGVGNGFGQYDYLDVFRDSSSALNRRSLDISDTRTSEAATIVDGQTFASDNLLREAIHRAYRLSGPARPPSVESSWDNSRRDRGDVRDSFESTITAGARSIASRGGTSNRRSRQSMARASLLSNTEASASEPQLPASHNTIIEPDQDSERQDPPSSLPRHERRSSG